MSDQRVGITPVLKRLAFSYLIRGIGNHRIEHPIYDSVDVRILYPWSENPAASGEYGAAISVSFMREKRRVRWVEFSIRQIGSGGDPTIFRVK